MLVATLPVLTARKPLQMEWGLLFWAQQLHAPSLRRQPIQLMEEQLLILVFVTSSLHITTTLGVEVGRILVIFTGLTPI